jgi:hypothetical protein
MATSTIITIAFFGVAAILVVAAFVWVWLKKRTQHRRRVEAGSIRDKAAEQSRRVAQREVLADETAAKARAAKAEAEAAAAQADRLEQQAQAGHSNAASARDEVDQAFERADKIDPDSQTGETPGQDLKAREPLRKDSAGAQGAPPMPGPRG